MLQGVDFQKMNHAFTMWAKLYVSIELGNWRARSVNGKTIRSTVSNYDKSYQNFVSLIRFFSQKRGQVVQVARLENGKSSGIPVVKKC